MIETWLQKRQRDRTWHWLLREMSSFSHLSYELRATTHPGHATFIRGWERQQELYLLSAIFTPLPPHKWEENMSLLLHTFIISMTMNTSFHCFLTELSFHAIFRWNESAFSDMRQRGFSRLFAFQVVLFTASELSYIYIFRLGHHSLPSSSLYILFFKWHAWPLVILS